MPLAIPLNDKYGLQTALSGLVVGLSHGIAEKSRYERERAWRERMASDANERDRMNFERHRAAAQEDYNRNRADKLADTESARVFEVSRDQARQTNLDAVREARDAADIAQGQELLRASGMGGQPEDFYVNPNAQPVVPRVGRQAAESLIANRRMEDSQRAAVQSRAVDDRRAEDALAETKRHNAAMEARPSGKVQLTPEQWKQAEALAAIANDKRQPMEKRQIAVTRLRELTGQPVPYSEGANGRDPEKEAQIKSLDAQAEYWRVQGNSDMQAEVLAKKARLIGGGSAPGMPTTFKYPADVQTANDKALYDRLMQLESGR